MCALFEFIVYFIIIVSGVHVDTLFSAYVEFQIKVSNFVSLVCVLL